MQSYRGRELWLRWVLTNAVGGAAGVAGIAVLGYPVLLCLTAFTGYYAIIFAPTPGWLLFALIVSMAQQWLLWPYSTLPWTPYSVLGSVGAVMVGAFVIGAHADTHDWAWAGLVAGGVLTLAQWLMLRSTYRHAWIWVQANMLGWAVGLAVAQGVFALLFGSDGPYFPSDPLLGLLFGVVNLPIRAMIGGILAAAITGAALLQLQRDDMPAATELLRPLERQAEDANTRRL